MALACATVLLALLALDPLRALLLFVVPLPPALLLTADATFDQHRGLRSTDPFAASRSDERRLYNLRTCNLGYHTAHHLQPGLHWSLLPALHARIRHRIPEECLVAETSPRAAASAHASPNQSPSLA
jgi:beta-carotene hydroxylase